MTNRRIDFFIFILLLSAVMKWPTLTYSSEDTSYFFFTYTITYEN